MILGGDEPWTRRVIGVSTCPQVGSMFNDGMSNAQTKTWEGSAIPGTTEGYEAHYTAFLLGMPFFLSLWLQYTANFAIATCLGGLLHFALDNGHGLLVGGLCRPEA